MTGRRAIADEQRVRIGIPCPTRRGHCLLPCVPAGHRQPKLTFGVPHDLRHGLQREALSASIDGVAGLGDEPAAQSVQIDIRLPRPFLPLVNP